MSVHTYWILDRFSELLARLGGDSSSGSGSAEMQTAVEAAMRRMVESPVTAGDFVVAAQTRFSEGDYERARHLAEKAICLDGQLPDGYHVRALSFYKEGRFSEAVGEMDRLIRVARENPVAHWKKGDFLVELGNYSEAIRSLTTAIELQPDLFDAICSRGISRSYLRQFEAALADFDRAIELCPRDARSHAGRGWVYSDLRKYDSAVEEFNVALRIEPSGGAYVGRSRALIELRKFTAALSDADEALAWDPESPSAFAIRGWAHFFLEDYQAAAVDFRRAISIEADNWYALYGSAWMKATCPDEQHRNGEQALQEAAVLDSQGKIAAWEVKKLIAACLAELGRFEEAMEKQREAVACAPPSVHDYLKHVAGRYEAGRPYRHSPSGVLQGHSLLPEPDGLGEPSVN